jgi:hypothetical protein
MQRLHDGSRVSATLHAFAYRFQNFDVFIQKCLPNHLKLMPNLRNMVFKVMPKLVYDATREYNKEKKAFDQRVREAEEVEKNVIGEKDEKKEDEAAQERELAAKNLAVL